MAKRKADESPEATASTSKPVSKSQRRRAESNDSSEDESSDEFTDSVVENSVVVSSGSVLTENSTEPVAGVILRISICNFMCHNRLEVNLGTHVNFIVGRNGSGKSAIVTALVVGLGGKATATSRGSSIKNFIKSGKRTGWVEICLCNKGKDSYKNNIYGDRIVVRRRFSIDGTSNYAIKNAGGQHISSRRDELCRITDHLSIQVDNPVSILNQDTSRNFLNTKSAGDKFKLFMKATQLEQMNADYNNVKRNKESTRQVIMSKEQTLPAMTKEVRVWENKFKNLTAISDLKEKVKLLRNEEAWAYVAEKEKGLKPHEKNLLAEEKALPRFVQKVEEKQAELKEWEERHKALEQRLIDCGKEVKDLEPMLQQRKKELKQTKDKLGPITDMLKRCERDLRSTKQDCKQCQDRIEELKVLASHDYEADRRKREEQIAKLEKNLEGIKSKQGVKEHELEQFRSAVAKYKSDVAQLEAQVNRKQQKLREVKTNIRTLQSAKNDRLQRFGPWMPAIIRSIEAKKQQFHKTPKGPVGACFDLAMPEWALAIENCLKGLLTSFICHDHHDEKILEQIFNQSDCPRYRRPTIITCAFSEQIHNVAKYSVKSNRYPSLLHVVKSDDPMIINTLIDQRGVEQILLIKTSEEARDVMLRNRPQNAKECFSLDGDQILCVKGTTRYYSCEATSVKYLMANVEDQIVKLQDTEREMERELDGLKHERDALHQEITKNQQQERTCQTHLNKAAESISQLTFEIKELQNVEDPAPVDVTTLEEEVLTYENRIKELDAERQEILQEKRKADEQLNLAKENYEKVQAEIREKSDNGIPLREEISQAQVEVENARANRKHYATKLKEQEAKIQAKKRDVDKYKHELDRDREKALKICERVETQRSHTSIENEIQQIRRRISEEEEQQGNEEEIVSNYKEKKETYDRVKREVRQLKNYLERLDEVMEKRQIAYTKMRRNIANRIKYYFLVQMFQRSFTGKMKFDFEKQTLEILVDTSQGSEKNGANTAKDLKSLSGGERSFSTVCFILSLWEAMESPFRCLDEFDVFMDMVNRRISMDMMMETADMHKNMQFVFLTPQDMRSVRQISNVKIFRMPDPERGDGQQTIGSSQA